MAKSQSPSDPAAAMLASMTAEQRTAYYKALGQEPPADNPPPDSSPAGALAPIAASVLASYEADAVPGVCVGLEDAKPGDYLTPRLKLLQALSDEVAKGTVPDARPGDWYLTSTGELWSGATGVCVVPCKFMVEFVEYVPRNAGGGFVCVHRDSDPIVRSFRKIGGRLTNPASGNDIQETARWYALVLTEQGAQGAVIDLKSTGLKVSKKWTTLVASQRLQGERGPFNPPMYAYEYRLGSDRAQNDAGQPYHVANVIVGALQSDPDIAVQARAFYELASQGAVKIAQDEGGPSSAPGAKPGFGDVPERPGQPF